jgi:signal transduction histidine kinase
VVTGAAAGASGGHGAPLAPAGRGVATSYRGTRVGGQAPGRRGEEDVTAAADPRLGAGEAQATIAALREANQRLVVAGLREQELAEVAEGALAATRRAQTAQAVSRRALVHREVEAVALRELLRLKDEFLGTLSHELRTPLQVVSGYGELLRLRLEVPGADPGMVQMVDHVVASAGQLAGMVKGLLTFAALGRGGPTVHPEDLDLVPVLRGVLAELRQEPRGSRLVAELPPTLPACADAAHVAQAVSNLVRNALTYAPTGPIALRARPTRRGTVRVEVVDAGPGVPPAARRRVWEMFYRGSPEHTSTARGFGIGLAVVKALTEAQGGRVGLVSSPGRGSRFWLELPSASGA